MTYTPDPTDATNPIGSTLAETAFLEFQALKGYIQQLLGNPTAVAGYREAITGAGFQAGDIIYSASAAGRVGCLLANGQAVSRITYAVLFSAIGTAYGIGDGSTTFNVPNYIGNFIVGSNTPAQAGGSSTVSLSINNLPVHNFAATSISTATVTDGGHTHVITDPGHYHGIVDPNHSHGITDLTHNHTHTDPQHTHTVNDPTHNHSTNNPAHNHTLTDPTHNHALTDPNHQHNFATNPITAPSTGTTVPGGSGYNFSTVSSTSPAATGITLAAASTGITIANAATSVTNNASSTGITNASAATGITNNASYTGITGTNNASTGITDTQTRATSITNNTAVTGINVAVATVTTTANIGNDTPFSIIPPFLTAVPYIKY